MAHVYVEIAMRDEQGQVLWGYTHGEYVITENTGSGPEQVANVGIDCAAKLAEEMERARVSIEKQAKTDVASWQKHAAADRAAAEQQR